MYAYILIKLITQILQILLLKSLALRKLYKWAHQYGMVCPQVADGEMASNMKGSCKYIE
jgi:hypothetical protein